MHRGLPRLARVGTVWLQNISPSISVSRLRPVAQLVQARGVRTRSQRDAERKMLEQKMENYEKQKPVLLERLEKAFKPVREANPGYTSEKNGNVVSVFMWPRNLAAL